MEADYSNDIQSLDRLLSSIMLIRSARNNNAILIVEGDDDLKFYRKFVCDESNVMPADYKNDIDDNPRGRKEKVIKTVQKAYEEGYKGIVGIIDADFDNLTIINAEENLYRTDTHDLESMILKSKRVLKDILVKYSKPNCLFSEEDISRIQDILLESSKYLGYTLWCSNEYRWMIRFKEFPIHLCINDKCELDIDRMYKCLINRSTKCAVTIEAIKVKVSDKVSDEWDLWQVCRGKEMLGILTYYIKHNIKNVNINNENLVDDLILAFNKDDLINTYLYISLRKWQDQNHNYSLINF